MTILHIDLRSKEVTTKLYPDLKPYVGGVGVSSKLILDHLSSDPVVFSAGPLNGFFPFASKTCAAFVGERGFTDTYVGGRLSLRFGFSGSSAVILENTSSSEVVVDITNNETKLLPGDTDLSSLGLLGSRSRVEVSEEGLTVDGRFMFGEAALGTKLKKMGLAGFVISGSQTFNIANKERYEKLFKEILSSSREMLISPGENPSCSGCPMGCEKSMEGEVGGNVLTHSLVACTYAEAIYGKIPVTFAALNCLEYDYTHEDLEALPDLVYSNIRKINEETSRS